MTFKNHLPCISFHKKLVTRGYRDRMTSSETTEMSCPRCGHLQTVEFYRSVNVTINPELRGELFGHGLNIACCERCGSTGFLPVPMFYHDMALRFLILLDSTNALGDDTTHIFEVFMGKGIVPPAFASMIGDLHQQYRTRIVSTYDRMLEKILVFEAGLDDRIIELLSYFIGLSYQEDQGDGSFEVFFEDLAVMEDEREVLRFRLLPDDKGSRLILVPRETVYREACEKFAPLCDDLDRESLTHRIDHEYATRLLMGRDV